MPDRAVIFDIDGPLLDLTAAEEALFFAPMRQRYGNVTATTDWNSYRIRNDVEIYREALENHLKRPPSALEIQQICEGYISGMRKGHDDGTLDVVSVPGAQRLLQRLSAIKNLALGVATANLTAAAELRLRKVDMWDAISAHVGAAEAGGPKSSILASVLRNLRLPPEHIVFLGDNLNDLRAAEVNGVHFIGFDVTAKKRNALANAGAKVVCGDHETSWSHIKEMLSL